MSKMKIFANFVLLLIIGLMVSGCINRATATVDPSTDLSSIKSLHVTKRSGDGREINLLIADKLKSMGYRVTTGTEKRSDVNAIVTYVDKWFWDITMYMLELTITLRDPQTDFPLASGNSYHTSLTRKSPKGMVDEVLTNIFKQAPAMTSAKDYQAKIRTVDQVPLDRTTLQSATALPTYTSTKLPKEISRESTKTTYNDAEIEQLLLKFERLMKEVDSMK
jgi:hypothetical protein